MSQFRVIADVNLSSEELAAVCAGEAVASCAKYFPFSTKKPNSSGPRPTDGERLTARPLGGSPANARQPKTCRVRRCGSGSARSSACSPARRRCWSTRPSWLTTPAPRSSHAGGRSPRSEAGDLGISQSAEEVDTVWISEPPEEAEWAATEKYHRFLTLPMVCIVTEHLLHARRLPRDAVSQSPPQLPPRAPTPSRRQAPASKRGRG